MLPKMTDFDSQKPMVVAELEEEPLKEPIAEEKA